MSAPATFDLAQQPHRQLFAVGQGHKYGGEEFFFEALNVQGQAIGLFQQAFEVAAHQLARHLAQQGRPAADAAIISLRNLGAGPMSADMGFLTADGQDFLQHSEQLLGQLVRRILDPAEPIRKTDDLDKCQYCPYRGICAR